MRCSSTHSNDVAVHVLGPLRGRLAVGDADVSRVAETIQARGEHQLASRLAGVARGRNVIVLSAESLSAFVLGLEIGAQPVASNLTAFARESLAFTQFFDQTHRGTTADAEFVSLNSLMPLPFGAVSTRYASNDFRALPHVLQERGYHTLSACAEPSSFWNMGGMHPKLGFARSLFAPDFAWTRSVGVGLDDASFFEQIVPTLRQGAEPFFAYLISSSNHHPYNVPPDLRRLRPGSVPEGLAGDYLQSVRYFDEAFGRFVADLAREGILDRTVVVVFGDHQSWLDDTELQRLWRASGHENDASEVDLWRLRRRVPLLVRLPHAAESGPRDTPGGQLDITPTLLSLLGVEGVTGPWLGRDLTAPSRNVVVLRDGSVTDAASISLSNGTRTPACYVRDGHAVPCEGVEPLAVEGRTILSMSDAIVSGNMARAVTADLVRRPRGTVRAPSRVLVIAHRGDSVHYPENTLKSIRAAFDLGADAVEVDVRLSRDGVPMVFHDDTLERTTNARGAFARLSVREAQSLDAGSWMSPRFVGARIPTLEEALRAARGRGDLLLDLKVDGLAAPVRAVYERVGVNPEAAMVGAWTPAQRSAFVREMPRARILKTEGAPFTWAEDLFWDTRRQGLWGFELGDDWPPPFIADAALHGVPTIAYTVNDEATMRRLIEAGVSGIETDDPGLLIRVAASLHTR
jgi:glycerophosphoryl diester phosphodiesterase